MPRCNACSRRSRWNRSASAWPYRSSQSLINLGVALVLMRVGKQHRSITLEADAHHLLTDVWTSVGVLVGVGLVAWTGWLWLDPVVALLVAANIVWAGVGILRRSVAGLMDTAWPEEEQAQLRTVMEPYVREGIQSPRRAHVRRARRFVSLHLLVPGDWPVRRGHALAEQVDGHPPGPAPSATVFTHIEPLEDPVSWADTELDRDGFDRDGPPTDATRET
ncbi:MAG: cation diffusion facilitator family transporter [Caldilineaceae bacterium]